MTEVWKSVVGYEGFYEVSNMGRVKSLARLLRPNGRSHMKPENFLTPRLLRSGYSVVGLSVDGVLQFHRVHRLVAKAFLDNPEGKAQVNHIDGDKLNNIVENLEWATAFENQQHAVNVLGKHGERCGNATIKNADIVDIRFLLGHGVRQVDVAKLYGVTPHVISRINCERSWSRVA